MIKAVLSWISCWFRAAGVVRQGDRITRQLQLMDATRNDSLAALRKQARELTEMQDHYAKYMQDTETRLEHARTIHKQDAEQIEALRGEKRILERTVEGLVAANQVYVARWEEETAVHVMRQVAAHGSRQE